MKCVNIIIYFLFTLNKYMLFVLYAFPNQFYPGSLCHLFTILFENLAITLIYQPSAVGFFTLMSGVELSNDKDPKHQPTYTVGSLHYCRFYNFNCIKWMFVLVNCKMKWAMILKRVFLNMFCPFKFVFLFLCNRINI